MEPSRLKRPAIQTQRPTIKATFGLPVAVPKVASTRSRPEFSEPVAPLNMDLPGPNSPARWPTSFRRPKRSGLRRWAVRGTALSLILIMTLGGLLFAQGYLKAGKVFKGGGGTAAALKTNVNPDLLKGEGSGRVNILLMGRGGGKHDAPDLTDTIMVASIDPVNHTATLLSIPRDLWVTVPNHGSMKLNAVWETGEFAYLGKNTAGSTDPKAIAAGFDLVDQTVEDVLGLTINYNTLVDFAAFQQAVDSVGGVSINVPTDLVDPTMAWENGGNALLAKSGLQNFDGASALRYVRSRETSSDFARSERQRAVLVALKSKGVSLGTLSNPIKISGLLSAFGDNIQADLSLKNAQRLYAITKDIKDASVTSISLADATNAYVRTGNVNGQSVVLPKAGLFNYDDIRQYVRSQLKDPYLLREHAKVLVLNGSTTPGLATKQADVLKGYGYNVVGVSNASDSNWSRTTLVDLSHGKKQYTKHYLEQRIGVSAVTSLPNNVVSTNGAEFVIIIGNDEANATYN